MNQDLNDAQEVEVEVEGVTFKDVPDEDCKIGGMCQED